VSLNNSNIGRHSFDLSIMINSILRGQFTIMSKITSGFPIALYDQCFARGKGCRSSILTYSPPGYGLDDSGAGVRFPAGIGNVSLLHRVQTGSEAHPASYPMSTGSSFSGGKVAGAWIWPLISLKCQGQECVELYLHLQYVFMEWCSVKYRDSFTLLYFTLL
jgi:hypothetical protein